MIKKALVDFFLFFFLEMTFFFFFPLSQKEIKTLAYFLLLN